MSNKLKIAIAACVAIALLVVSVAIGSAGLHLADEKTRMIIAEIRLPRAILAFLVGGCVALSGAVIQSVLKNPLASPYILGISSGASLGAGLVMLLTSTGAAFAVSSLGGLALPLAGFIAALLTVVIVVGFSARLDRAFSDNTVILFGMVFSLFTNAVLTALISLFRAELRGLIIWQMGSFAGRGWSSVFLLLPFLVIGTCGILFYTREMDILTFGDDEARSLGVETSQVRRALFLFSAVLTGAAVSLSGTIGFVDLIAPHVARRIAGSRHRYVIPLSFLAGGSLCVAADIIARTIVAPSELPVGAVTALIGAPFFVWVYFNKNRHPTA